jgi:hypothetical protein
MLDVDTGADLPQHLSLSFLILNKDFVISLS